MTTFDVVVLAGGDARRMGGEDKLAIEVGGTSVLDRVVSSARSAGARTIVAVGPRRPTTDPEVRWVIEDEPGGGPVPAIATGVRALDGGALHAGEPDDAPVVVLAGDQPFVSTTTIASLVGALGDHEAAVAVDVDGRDQFLTAAFRRRSLRAANTPGAPARTLLDGLSIARIVTAGEETLDCDTPDDVELARLLARDER